MHLPTVITAALVAAVLAHPGHDHDAEQAVRREALQFSKRDLSHCAAKIKARGLEARSVKRRSGIANNLLKKRNLKNRDIDELLDTSHHSSESFTLDTPVETIFASNNSCILSPEVTEGPYYVAGEYIREDVTEDQLGIDLALDVQVLDVNTCEPVPDVYLEIWHCNSTGVYSGVVASGNGNANPSNINATFLRGVQQTDADGAATFQTLFPGHYTGRTTHIHVMVHTDATAFPNGTLIDTTHVGHVGQIFFDQDLIGRVEATAVYAANTQALTTNEEDEILAEEAESSDPFVQYVLLGESVEEGLLGWLSFGIDTSLQKSVSAAATLYAEGGVANPNAGGGGPGGPPPSGGFPSGPGGPASTASA
ncbi:Intradiol ring-cleavage dioxygenase [Coniochaeta sp. 2T2.1]|nr:Intradiol ring-cleavage dioxygenase [Coniochaeta sp. 2T2.1]